MEEAVVAAVVEADKAIETASLRHARGFASESTNRRISMPNGETLFRGASFYRSPPPEALERACGIFDQEVGAIQLLDASGNALATLVHYAVHPLTVSVFAREISADFLGPLVRRLEESFGAPAMFLQGACGDLNPKGIFEGYLRQEALGRVLCEETTRILNQSATPEAEPELAATRCEIALPVDPDRRSGKLPDYKGKACFEFNDKLFREAYECEMGAILVGPVAFVTCPGELLCEPGLQIKSSTCISATGWNFPGAAGVRGEMAGWMSGGNCLPGALRGVVKAPIAFILRASETIK